MAHFKKEGNKSVFKDKNKLFKVCKNEVGIPYYFESREKNGLE